MKEGKGVWKKSGSDEVTNTYEGEYLQDMKHGQGEFRWASGGYYKGHYEMGIVTGHGKLICDTGEVYVGEF